MASAKNLTDGARPDQARALYETPVLRAHGALRDLTSGPSVLSGTLITKASDVNLKENIVAVSWA